LKNFWQRKKRTDAKSERTQKANGRKKRTDAKSERLI